MIFLQIYVTKFLSLKKKEWCQIGRLRKDCKITYRIFRWSTASISNTIAIRVVGSRTIENAIVAIGFLGSRTGRYVGVIDELRLDGGRVNTFIVEKFLNLFSDFHVLRQVATPKKWSVYDKIKCR